MEINPNLLSVLQKIVIRKSISQEELMEELGCSKSQMRYKISLMNKYLRNDNLPELSIKYGKVYSFCDPQDIISNLSKKTASFKKMIGYLSLDERLIFECILIFCSSESLGIKKISYLFQVSRSSIINDFKKLNIMIENYDLKLTYSRQEGYYFEGSSKNIRSLIFFCIYKMCKNYFYQDLLCQILEKPELKTSFEEIRRLLVEALEKNRIRYTEEYFEQVLCMITLLQFYCQSPNYKLYKIDENDLYNNFYLTIANNIYDCLPFTLPIGEVSYLTVLILCMGHDIDVIKEMAMKFPLMKLITEELISRFIYFTNMRIQISEVPENLIEDLSNHLILSDFRMKYGFYIINPFLKNIQKNYGDIFNIIRMIIQNMDYFGDLKINNHEVGYLVMYLVTILEYEKKIQFRFSALIVCPRGTATRSWLVKKLSKTFPDFDFESTHDLNYYVRKNQTKFDVIFSSENNFHNINKPFFDVSGLISDFDFNIEEFKQQVLTTLKKNNAFFERVAINSDELIDMIKPYCNIHDIGSLRKTLSDVSIIIRNNPNRYHQTQQLPLRHFLPQENINVVDNIFDWKSAIRLSAEPLITSGCITDKYIKACIELAINKGPYIIIYPFISIPHAFSEDGVDKVGMSMLNITNPVNLLDNPKYPVQIFILLATVDNKQHVKALGELATILAETEKRSRLLASSSTEAIMEVMYTS